MTLDVNIGIRWTIGDVSDRGFEALRLSILGAANIFGVGAEYAVCVNTLTPPAARKRTGDVPPEVAWHNTTGQVPDFLEQFMDPGMAEGVGWKFAPLRLFPDRHEIALDNDCILWEIPESIRGWLEGAQPRQCLIARDVRPAFGRFAAFCGPAPCNTGIRGLPPGFDFEAALQGVLQEQQWLAGEPLALSSELDEQGLQTAALSREQPPAVVDLHEVSICSPFWPHLPELGRCGAHFVGINARHIPWDYYDRSADVCSREHWNRHRPALYRNVGLPLSEATSCAPC